MIVKSYKTVPPDLSLTTPLFVPGEKEGVQVKVRFVELPPTSVYRVGAVFPTHWSIHEARESVSPEPITVKVVGVPRVTVCGLTDVTVGIEEVIILLTKTVELPCIVLPLSL